MLLASSSRASPIITVNPNVRGRPSVSGGTLKTDTGQIIRAGRIQGSVAAAQTSLVWERCRALGINCMRVGFTVGTSSLSSVGTKLDAIVNAARNNRCYVMLCNPEWTPGTYDDNIATNEAKSMSTWAYVADRYKDEDHVFYEVLNEPEAWGQYSHYSSTTGSPTDLTRSLRRIFDMIRGKAPETVILIPSCASIDAAGMTQYIKAIQAFESLGPVDWTRACWSFHGYNQTGRMQVSSKYTAPSGNANLQMAPDMGRAALIWLRARYPIICTETNWWENDGVRLPLLDYADACEDAAVGYVIMSYPQQVWSASKYDSYPLYGSFLDNKVAQLRARGFSIPVE